jgi:hypothetical protein
LVKLHDQITPLVNGDWQDLSERYDSLLKDMIALESETIPNDDQKREKYKKDIAKLNIRATYLKSALEEEPEKRKKANTLVVNYKRDATKLKDLFQYIEDNKLQSPIFKQLAQAKGWLDAPSEKQKASIVNLVKLAEAEVNEHKALVEKQKQADEQENRSSSG